SYLYNHNTSVPFILSVEDKHLNGYQKMKMMFKIIIVYLITISSALALKCYVCENADDPKCYELKKDKTSFLQECGKNETKCALLVDLGYKDFLERRCVKADYQCHSPYKCKFCLTDGCNEGTDTEEEPIIRDTEEFKELVMANIYSIGVMAFLLLVLIIWCIIRITTKSDVTYSDSEVDEDDEGEVYENKV
ncbi:hypothetical protein DOY81_000007, partial [Sarcophaga bullata]